MTKLSGKTPDLTAERIEQLRSIFPEVFEEGKINFDRLKQELGGQIDSGQERYHFTWNGKNRALRLSQASGTGTLRPCMEESKNWDSTRNLYLEGDNLEVLKLLQKSYHEKIQMIYIDPPYNTGKDFIYPDHFSDSIRNYQEWTGQVDKAGRPQSTNSETDGRFHSKWLSMMYPRLRLARNLLADSGVMFVSLDDNEIANLIKVCDEIFGEGNRIAVICHKSRASVSNDKIISPNHNFILFYAKNRSVLEQMRRQIGLDPDLSGFPFDDADGKGPYRLVPVDGPGGARKGNPYFEFLGVKGYFRFSKETMRKKYQDGFLVKKGNRLYQKYYLRSAEQTRRTDTTWWEDGGLTSSATAQLKSLLQGSYFDNPKPVELIVRMLKLTTFYHKDATILDFFSGSATTAHAVMQMNAEDGGCRRFIMVQLPEPCAEGTEAAKAGYKNICEIGKERIRRAGELVRQQVEEKNSSQKPDQPLKKVPDIGFRVFKLDSSNVKRWNPEAGMVADDAGDSAQLKFSAEKLAQDLMNSLNDGLPGRTELDLVYEILLKMGFELTSPLSREQIDGKNVYVAASGALMLCLGDGVTLDTARGMAELHRRLAPETWKVVFRDCGFASDSDKVNVYEILKSAGLKENNFTTV